MSRTTCLGAAGLDGFIADERDSLAWLAPQQGSRFDDGTFVAGVGVTIAPATLGAGRPLPSGRFDLRLVGTVPDGDVVAVRHKVLRAAARPRP